MLAPNSPWRIGARFDFYALDPNAELFRPELKGQGEEEYIAPDLVTEFERRLLPPVPHSAAVSDCSAQTVAR